MRILLAQTSFLGDTILSTPVISGIKTCYPNAQLWMMTTPLSSELVIRDPLLDGVITHDKRKRDSGLSGLLRISRRLKAMQFDIVYSLHRSYRTSLLLWLAGIPLRIGCPDAKLAFLYHEVRTRDFQHHDVMRNLSILSGEIALDSIATEMRLFPPSSREISSETLKRLPPRHHYVVLVPGSVWKTKMWHWEGYREVAQFLLKLGIQVVLLGSESDNKVCTKVSQDLNVINLAGQTTISEAMYVVKNARLMVCNDSMSLHMASAMKIPTVAVFCATSPDFGYGPWKNKAVIVEKKGLNCKPCRSHGSPKCPTGTQACMQDLPADQVIRAVQELMDTQ